ncbi:MAG: ATP-binding cassette domain-containing protein [Chloroflexota bacterium]
MNLSGRLSANPTVQGLLAVLRLMPDASPSGTALLAAGVLMSALLPLALTVTTGLVVGAVTASAGHGLASLEGQVAVALLAGTAGFMVATQVLGPTVGTLATVLGREVDRLVQERIIAAVNRPVGIAHLEDPVIVDLIAHAQQAGTGGRRPSVAVAALATLLPSWLQALGSALLLLHFHWWLALAWVAVWPILLYALHREFLRVGQTRYAATAALRRANYFRDLALGPVLAKELRLWGLLGWSMGRFDTAWRTAMIPVWDLRNPARPVPWLAAAAVGGLTLSSFALLAWAATHGQIAIAALAVYIQAIGAASNVRAAEDANANLALAAAAAPALARLAGQLAGADATATAAGSIQLAGAPCTGLRFENVSFRYPRREEAVLNGLDLAIPTGRSLAIVGANGAGKTTIVKLICRLYDPSAGRLTVDGVDLRTLDVATWRRGVAAIFQDFAQYQLSARENVGLN